MVPRVSGVDLGMIEWLKYQQLRALNELRQGSAMPECSLNFFASLRVGISYANAAIAFAFLLIGWPLVILACYLFLLLFF